MIRKLIVGLILVAIPVFAGHEKTLEKTMALGDAQSVFIDAGVGEVSIRPSIDDQIHIKVTVKAKRRFLFFGTKKKHVEMAQIDYSMKNNTLVFKIKTDERRRKKRHFEEEWVVMLPVQLNTRVELGVGEINIKDMASGIRVDLGVGDIDLSHVSGNINVDLGVGDVDVILASADYKRINIDVGVGDSTIRKIGVGRSDEDGFLAFGRNAKWRGTGKYKVSIDVGVGDALVKGID